MVEFKQLEDLGVAAGGLYVSPIVTHVLLCRITLTNRH